MISRTQVAGKRLANLAQAFGVRAGGACRQLMPMASLKAAETVASNGGRQAWRAQSRRCRQIEPRLVGALAMELFA
jgi:hypothetical protein